MKEAFNMDKYLVLCSGGVDSTTCLGMAVDKAGKENVFALTAYYGQRHEKEIEAAKNVCNYYGVSRDEIDLSNVFTSAKGCSLLKSSDMEVPEESYSEQLKSRNGKPVTTYVPFRNGLFLSVATAVAISKGCNYICYGAHADDAAGNAYPDCSDAFYKAMDKAVYEGSGQQVHIKAPFIGITKAEVVKIGLSLNAPYELTWSCYEGGDKPCGKCGTCIDRAKAFEANGVSDPALEDI